MARKEMENQRTFKGGMMKKFELRHNGTGQLHVGSRGKALKNFVCGPLPWGGAIFYPGTVKAFKALIDQGKVCKRCLAWFERQGLDVLQGVKLRP